MKKGNPQGCLYHWGFQMKKLFLRLVIACPGVSQQCQTGDFFEITGVSQQPLFAMAF